MISRLCCLLLLSWSSQVFADPIGFTSLATATTSINAANGIGSCPPTLSVSGPNMATANLSCTLLFQVPGSSPPQYLPGTITGLAMAQVSAGFNFLNTSVSAAADCANDMPSCGSTSSAAATASGSFSDTMTIFGGSGIANLQWAVEASTSLPFLSSTVNQISYLLPTQVIYGDPFAISASVLTGVDPSPYPFGQANASATFQILGLSVNGSFQSWQYSTGSNTDYDLDPGGSFIAAPEPSYFWLVGALLVVGAVFGRKPKVRPFVAR